MSNLTFLLLGLQACLQTVYSQYADLTQAYASIALPNSLHLGYGFNNNNILNYNKVGNCYKPFSPRANYGGIGSGLLRVAGELPVTGTTVVGGQVPIIGAVKFSGKLPAVGRVIITGTCGCGRGCNAPYKRKH